MSDFKTITGQSWADALPKARKRRQGAGKRIAEAVKKHACAGCGQLRRELATRTP